MRALIVGNGEPPSRELFADLMAPSTILMCADGGADTALRYGHRPEFVVGDLDSLSDETRAAVPADRHVSVVDQNATDMEKVLERALAMGVTVADLIGFTGRRTDHTLWNLSLLKRYAARIRLRLLDDYCEIRLLGARSRFEADIGQKLSLCPLSGPVTGVETRGLKWALRGEMLGPERAGISNEVTASPVEVRSVNGDLLLVVQRDSASGTIVMQD